MRGGISFYDNIMAINSVMLKGKRGEIYNVSVHNELANIEVVKQLMDIINSEYGKKNKMIYFRLLKIALKK